MEANMKCLCKGLQLSNGSAQSLINEKGESFCAELDKNMKTGRTMLKTGTSIKETSKSREMSQKQFRGREVQVAILRNNQLQMCKAGSSQADSVPPAKGLKAMWYYMLKHNWKCHVSMRQADVTMACINSLKTTWSNPPALPSACRTSAGSRACLQHSVLVMGHTSREKPKGSKECEEGGLQSTSETTRASSSREGWEKGVPGEIVLSST